MTQTLIILRGLPGSGKSTFAEYLRDLYNASTHSWSMHNVEADQYFETVDGQYLFVPELIKEAHEWCKKRTESLLLSGSSVIVSNTFSRKWEYEPYLEMAKKYGVRVFILEAQGRFQNIHNVPEEAISRMKDRWETP